MDFSLTAEQKLIRDNIIAFARQELEDDVIKRDRDQDFAHDLWLKCGTQQLQGLCVDEEYGGLGFDAVTTILALEALGYSCTDGGLNFAICAHLLASVVPVWKHGSEAQKNQYLPDLCQGKLIAVNGMTEPESGSDVFNIRTSAVRDGDHYVINGVKTFASNGPIADVVILYAVTNPAKGFNGGISAFIIDKSTPGFKVGQRYEKMGLRTCPISELIFEDVMVPKEALLGGEGGGGIIFNHSMMWERVGIAACHVGTMDRLLEAAIEYTKVREVGGQNIGKHQAVSHKIANMKARIEAARMLTYKSAWGLDHNKYNSLDASITKLYVSEALVDVAMNTMNIYGGNGYMTDYGIERTLRDALAGTIYSGTSDIQRNIIARWLGVK